MSAAFSIIQMIMSPIQITTSADRTRRSTSLQPDDGQKAIVERAYGGPGRQGNRLDAFAGQITYQPAAVSSQVFERGETRKAFTKATEVLPKPAT